MSLLNGTASQYWIEYIVSECVSANERYFSHTPWFYASLCSSLVGLSGLFPVFLLSLGKTSEKQLQFMLSFACGGLLGDVFLHLLPEAHERIATVAATHEEAHAMHSALGLWMIAGILTFIVLEMMMKEAEGGDDDNDDGDEKQQTISSSGYLNLVANCIDNFAHGLAVGGAFLVSNRTGFVTTSCILMHEIPHEIGDFAILMKSGFDKVGAAKAQFSTAFLGILGSLLALAVDSYTALDTYTAWIIPFTSGGFLHIALVGVLPDLMKADSVGDCVRVLGGIGLGIAVMAGVSAF